MVLEDGDGGELEEALGLALTEGGVRFDEPGAVGGNVFAEAEMTPAADGVDGFADVGR